VAVDVGHGCVGAPRNHGAERRDEHTAVAHAEVEELVRPSGLPPNDLLVVLLVDVVAVGDAVLVRQRLDEPPNGAVLAVLPRLGDGPVAELAVPGEVPP